MEQETLTVEKEILNESATNSQKEHKRSASYPSLTIDEALKWAAPIYEKYSTTQSVTREEIAVGLELKNANSISRDVAACVHYGFLSKSDDGYRVSELYHDIKYPESENDKKLKLITAFGTPKLFKELIAKFDNTTIPLEFANTLIKHHSITENAAPAAADIFIKSGQSVGVINESRLLKYQVTLSAITKSQPTIIVEETISPTNNSLPVHQPAITFTAVEQDKRVPIHLTNDKVALLSYPRGLTEKDIKLLQHEIEGILLRIRFEKEEDEEAKKGAITPPVNS